MCAAGLDVDLAVTADFTASGGAAATAALLDLEPPPTAIVYANDVMAIAGMSVAAARGVSVPDQLSVTGFDDTELARHLSPALTTVRSDALGWGAAAAKLLLDVIEAAAARGPDQPERSQGIHVELPPAELVLRNSCAPPPSTRRRTTRASTTRPSATRASPAPPSTPASSTRTESEKV